MNTNPLPLLLIITGLTLALPAAEPAGEGIGPDGETVTSRVTDVVVYADRAQVTRSASVTPGSVAARFVFEKLPGWIDEGSVRMGLQPADAGQILDVQVIRTYLARATDEDYQKAEAAVRDVADQIAALDDEKGVLEAEGRHVEAIRLFTVDKLPKDGASREVKPSEYVEPVKFITTSLREIATGRRDIEKKRRALQPELEARQKRLNELRQRSQLEQRTVVATVKGANKPATLSLTYMLPGATWEPVHELRAAQNTTTVHLGSYAAVMQSSGEDWNDVNISLSTQRSTETMRIPELEALLVGNRRLPPLLTADRDTFMVANKNYEAQNTLWFDINNNDVARQSEFRGNLSRQFDNARRVELVFQRLQQRGTTAHFAGQARQTIRSDGRSVRVPIGSANFTAQPRILAAPELSLNAARVVDLANTTKLPLLPGRVALYLDGAFLGQTDGEFVAPGEEFSLYLGMADHIKLSRTLDRKRSAMNRGGSKTKMQVSFLVSVENLSDQPAIVQLADRVPVSEIDAVRVSSVRIQPDGKPDAKGLLHWDLTLAAKQAKEYRIEYMIEYPTEFALSPAVGDPGPAGARGGGGGDLMLRQQIQSLEKKF